MYKATESEMTECVNKIEETFLFINEKLKSPEIAMRFLFFTVATLVKEGFGEDEYGIMCRTIPRIQEQKAFKDSMGNMQ